MAAALPNCQLCRPTATGSARARTPHCAVQAAGHRSTGRMACRSQLSVNSRSIITLVLALAAAAGTSTATDPVRDWLSGLEVALEPQVFKIPIVGSFMLQKIECHSIKLEKVTSDSTCSETRPSLQLGATGIGLQCAVDWRIEGPINYGPGTATAILADASLGFGMSLSRDASLSGLATAGKLDQCTITAAPKLTFKGSFSSAVLNLLKPFITSSLPGIVQTQGCQFLSGLVETNVTQALVDANAVITPFLQPQPMPVNAHQAGATPGLVDLRTAALTGVLTFGVDKLLVPQLNTLVDGFTHGTGAVDLGGRDGDGAAAGPGKSGEEYLLAIPLVIPGLANITIAFESIHVSGLDTWTPPMSLLPSSVPRHHRATSPSVAAPATESRDKIAGSTSGTSAQAGKSSHRMVAAVGPETLSLRAALKHFAARVAFTLIVEPHNGTVTAGTLVESGVDPLDHPFAQCMEAD